MTGRETAGRQGKGEDGRARTREAKLAVFFTQDELDADGYPVRDPDSASVITTFGPAAEFGRLVRAEGIRRGADHIRQFTVIGDGAPWIWGIASEKFPEATQMVDLFHAREHIHSLTRAVEFMLGDRRDEWLEKRLDDLDYGDIEGIERAVREFPFLGVKKDEVDRELGYFLNNAPRMRYHWFRSRGLFTGSGVVEASCKNQRRTTEAVRNALDTPRRRRHHHPPRRTGQPPLERNLPPRRHSDTRRLTHSHPSNRSGRKATHQSPTERTRTRIKGRTGQTACPLRTVGR
jgi:hypothetical protein